MANRVTVTEVKQIITLATSYVDADITISINVANRLVTDVCVDSSLGTARLKDIELYLSAHFCAINKQHQASMEKADVVSQSFQHQLGLNLQATMYGQQALMLDTSGALSQLSAGKKTVATFKTINPIVSDL